MPASKLCRKCGEDKPVSAFYLGRTGKAASPCKACKNSTCRRYHAAKSGDPSYRASRRASQLRSLYGIKPSELDALRDAQGGNCPICTRRLSDVSREHVDHCHSTGRVRGVLCSECNTGIGKLKDDPEILRRALTYLTI